MSAPLPALLSVVLVLRNTAARLPALLGQTSRGLASLATDHELIVVDNGSTDDSVAQLRELAGADGLPNLQVYALTKEVDFDTAAWAGVESAIGDYVAVLDPLREDARFLATMIEAGADGADVVFAENEDKGHRGLGYRIAAAVFHRTYRWLNGVDLRHDAPRYRLLSRRIVNFLLRHPVPALSYRLLPATAGFRKANLRYRATPVGGGDSRLVDDVERAVRLIVSSTRAPMRLVTGLSLFGAVANVLYSVYVIAVAILKRDVAPGWVTLSLQQSGMFLLMSLVLLVLGEYILHMAALSTEGPRYHVAQEFTSAVQTRRRRLNVEEAAVVALAPRGKASGASP